jgi:hypothetical protein
LCKGGSNVDTVSYHYNLPPFIKELLDPLKFLSRQELCEDFINAECSADCLSDLAKSVV